LIFSIPIGSAGALGFSLLQASVKVSGVVPKAVCLGQMEERGSNMALDMWRCRGSLSESLYRSIEYGVELLDVERRVVGFLESQVARGSRVPGTTFGQIDDLHYPPFPKIPSVI
jgi:hypothetical protein